MAVTLAGGLKEGGTSYDLTSSLGTVVSERLSVNNNMIILPLGKTGSGTNASDSNEGIDILGVTVIITITGQIAGTLATMATKISTIRDWVDSPSAGGTGLSYISDTLGSSFDSVLPLNFDGEFSSTLPFIYNYSLSFGYAQDAIGG